MTWNVTGKLKSSSHPVEVTAERLSILFKHSYFAISLTLFCGSLMTVALSKYVESSILIGWYLALVASTVFRAFLTHQYQKKPCSQDQLPSRKKALLTGVFMSGVVWGSAIFLFQPENFEHQMLIMITVIGMTGGAVSVYSASLIAFLSFTLPILVSVAAYYLINSDLTAWPLFAMVLVYGTSVIVMARFNQKQIEDVLMLKHANQGLKTEVDTQVELKSALYNSEQRFKDFAESSTDFFWELNSELDISLITSHAENVMGVSADRLEGLPWTSLIQLSLGSQAFESVNARLENRLALSDVEFVWETPDGYSLNLQVHGRAYFSEFGEFKGYRGVGRDISKQVKLMDRLSHQAQHDPLTDLYNRREFMHRLDVYLETLRVNDGEGVLCYIDLDHFKAVNDTAGHLVGDELIKQIASLLRSVVRDVDTIARFGSDEFVILFRGNSLPACMQMSDRLLSVLRDYHFTWGPDEFYIGASLGLTEVKASSESSMQLMAEANMACTAAKGMGRNRVEIYNPSEQAQAQRLAGLGHVTVMRQALQDGKLRLLFQPIIPLKGIGLEPHLEVLLGMENSAGKIEPCGLRIQSAEHYGLMPEVDRWVIREAFRCYRDNEGEEFPVLGINLSGSSLEGTALFDYIEHQLRVSGIPPKKVCFEITETAAIHNLEDTQNLVSKLQALGCRFALDDFGNGLSNFSYLKRLSVDYLKIDGSFVSNIATDTTDRAMVAAISRLAKELGMVSVGEFVEKPETMDVLKELGVDYGQGFGLGRPSHLLDKVIRQCANTTGNVVCERVTTS